jgi:glycosyltransferase involved in cell wall biosynthesis
MTKRTRVFVGMPVYNGDQFVEEAIECILNQTFKDFIIFISDNASTDQTENICRRYAAKDNRIVYFRHNRNVGPVRNFQYVKNQNSGQYFMWAAADDRRSPEFLQSLVDVLDRNPLVACAMSDVVVSYGPSTVSQHLKLESIRSEYLNDNERPRGKKFFVVPPTHLYFCIYGLFRSDLIQNIDLNVNSRYISGSEVPFLAEVSLNGAFVSVPGFHFESRKRAGSVHELETRNKGSLWIIKQRLLLSQDLIKIAISGKRQISDKVLLILTIMRSVCAGTFRTALRTLGDLRKKQSLPIPPNTP